MVCLHKLPAVNKPRLRALGFRVWGAGLEKVRFRVCGLGVHSWGYLGRPIAVLCQEPSTI